MKGQSHKDKIYSLESGITSEKYICYGARLECGPLIPVESNDNILDGSAALSIYKGENISVGRARIFVLISAALYGTNFYIVKALISTIPIEVSIYLRFGIASIATFYWLIKPLDDHSANLRTSRLRIILTGFEIGAWNALGYFGQAIGLETITASKSSFICALTVIVIPFLDIPFGKIVSTQRLVGTVISIIGVMLMQYNTGDSLSFSIGDMYSFIQPIAFGIGYWRIEHAMKRFPNEALRITASQLFAIFLASSTYYIVGKVGQQHPFGQLMLIWLSEPSILFPLIWIGIITTSLTFFLETVAMGSISASETALLFSTTPIWSSVFAAIFGEKLTLPLLFGGFFILAGISVCTWESVETK